MDKVLEGWPAFPEPMATADLADQVFGHDMWNESHASSLKRVLGTDKAKVAGWRTVGRGRATRHYKV